MVRTNNRRHTIRRNEILILNNHRRIEDVKADFEQHACTRGISRGSRSGERNTIDNIAERRVVSFLFAGRGCLLGISSPGLGHGSHARAVDCSRDQARRKSETYLVGCGMSSRGPSWL